jgi:peptide/nickel transport system ATP-binding protein
MSMCADQPPPVREPSPGRRIHCHLPINALPGALNDRPADDLHYEHE